MVHLWGKNGRKLRRSLLYTCFGPYENKEAGDCPKAAMLWQLIFALFGVWQVIPFSIKDVILNWHDTFVGKKRKKVWRATPLCFFFLTL